MPSSIPSASISKRIALSVTLLASLIAASPKIAKASAVGLSQGKLSAGTHRIEADARGWDAIEREIDVEEGSDQDITIELKQHLASLGRPRIDQIEVRFYTDLNAIKAGLLAGTVDAHLGRTDGCQTAAWQRLKPLLEP